jgi:hypothetical protein
MFRAVVFMTLLCLFAWLCSPICAGMPAGKRTASSILTLPFHSAWIWLLPRLCREADLWLNDPEVRKAIHAAPLDVTGPWTICSDRILYTADAGSMLPIHKQLTRKRGARQRLLQLLASFQYSGRELLE